ncbi:MAG: UbiA family prenyltransferase [Calditrichaeota bacterium]|nr:UbiA family prenyltransferase [Calditrichota bacterium]
MKSTSFEKQKIRIQLIGLWQLLRPVNVLIGALSIGVGAGVSGSLSPVRGVLLACLSGGLITGAANAVNDYFDVAIDRINKPARPLPSGKVSPAVALVWSLFLFALGIALSFGVNSQAAAIAVLASVLLFLYSWRFKRLPLIGNFTVSFISALAFVYGGVAVGRFQASLIPATFAFLFHFGREILKDIEDITGDRAQNARTFPICCGVLASKILITVIFFLLILATLFPYFKDIYNDWYFVLVLPGVDVFLVYVIWALWKSTEPAHLHKLSTALKVDMLVGLVSILVGIQNF